MAGMVWECRAWEYVMKGTRKVKVPKHAPVRLAVADEKEAMRMNRVGEDPKCPKCVAKMLLLDYGVTAEFFRL